MDTLNYVSDSLLDTLLNTAKNKLELNVKPYFILRFY